MESLISIRKGTKVKARRRFSHGTFHTSSGKTDVEEGKKKVVKEGMIGTVTYVEPKTGHVRVKFDKVGKNSEQFCIELEEIEALEFSDQHWNDKKNRRQSQNYVTMTVRRDKYLAHVKKKRLKAIAEAARVAIHAAEVAIREAVRTAKSVVSHTRERLKSRPEFSTVRLAELSFRQIFTKLQNLNENLSILPKDEKTLPCLKLECVVKSKYVVFERGVRECHFFMFLLCHSSSKNVTRIAHSYHARKSLENHQYSNAQSIVTNT